MTNFTRFYDVAGKPLQVASPDPQLLDEIARVLPPSPETSAEWSVSVEIESASDGTIRFDPADDHEDLRASVGTSEFPFHAIGESKESLVLVFAGETAPILWTRGAEIMFRVDPRWRTVVSLLIYHKALRLRSELIFFHAATVDVNGAGCMFVGPKGAGKSTTALALAARGHQLLGDETAAWNPTTGTLHAFLRDLGVKPGPRAIRIGERLRELGRDPESEGILRLRASDMFPHQRTDRSPRLRAIFFLRPFAEEPQLAWREAARDDLRRLQPITGSTVNASIGMRTFQLSRMVSSSRICELTPGGPDASAELIEKEVSRQWV